MEKEINLKNLYNIIKKRLWIIVLLIVLFTTASGLYSYLTTTPLYQSSTRIIIGTDSEIMKTLEVMIKEPIILDKVVQEMELNRSSGALRGQISVQRVSASQIVVITVVDSDPVLAAKIANTIANVYKRDIGKVMNFTNVSILTEAEVHPYPINENLNRKIILGFIMGLMAGVGVVFLLDSLDDTVKSERDVEQLLELPVLGSVSKMNKKNTATKVKEERSLPKRGESDWFLKKANQQIPLEKEV